MTTMDHMVSSIDEYMSSGTNTIQEDEANA